MPTFAEALFSLPTPRLRELAAVREMDPRRLSLASDKRQLVQFMAAELSKPDSISRAVLRCNARELRLLQLMLALDSRQSVSWKTVVDAAGGSRLDKRLGDVLTGLERLGLAVRTGDTVLLLEAVRHQVPTSLSDHYTVVGCLQNYDAPTLRNMAQKLGTGGGTKAENIEAIARRLLFADDQIFGSIVLDSEERAVLDYIVQSGGGATAIEVASAVLGSTDDFFRYDWQNRWKIGKERNAIDRLLARGMIFVVSYAYGFNLYLVIPGDLLRALTGESRAIFWTSPAPTPRTVEAPPETARLHNGIIRDAVSLLGFVTTQEAVRTNTGYVHKTSLKNFTRILTLQNEGYAGFIYALSRQAGLIAAQPETHTYAVTEKGRAWLSMNRLEQIQALVAAWRNSDLWGEMYSEPLRRANEFRPLDGVISVRNAAIELASFASDGGFIDIGSLTDALGYRYPLLLAQSTHLGGDLVPSPAMFMRVLVGQCLYWLGLAELAWLPARPATASKAGSSGAPRAGSEGVSDGSEDPSGPDAYRLTPEGAYILGVPGATAPQEHPSESQFIVQANLEIFIPPYLDARTLYYLSMITEVPGKAASGSVVAITRDSVRRALDQGVAGREILEFLRSHARTGIPQNVEYLINEVSEKHGHIHIGRAQMYLQVDTPLVLKELQARRELKNYIVRTLGDTVAILNTAEPDKLLKELRKAGYLPIYDDASRPRSVKFGAESVGDERTRATPVSSKPEKRAPGGEATVDWVRIAEADGRAWRETGSSPTRPDVRPQDAVRDKGNMRYLLLDAIRESRRVEIVYQGQSDPTPQTRIIEPQRVMGNFVVAYLPLEAEEVTLNINRMAWARLTGDFFAPP